MLNPKPATHPVVSSYNEWDPLEEVIVGSVEGACVPSWHVALEATMPESAWSFFKEHGGKPFPAEMIAAASRDLDELVRVLEGEGITVVRPAPTDHSRPFTTPGWHCPAGLYSAMPRDLLLVVGDEIIETPMSWRCRHHEVDAYRPLLLSYFRAGARWTAAPRPLLADELYDSGYDLREGGRRQDQRYLVRELEPAFDAADFVRCGRDLFVQQSHVTNDLGIQWLERHLGADFRIHRVDVRDRHPMHIDASFMPLAPGKLLINRERIPKVPAMFRSWDVLEAPPPVNPTAFLMCSNWVSMNVLMLDERRVIVEREEEPLVRALRSWGFDPIPLGFRGFNPFGGAFHCATLDIRRRGTLESYF
ncbi:MAG TPA: amidinotransferase [Thermoanaerobaculia bacterium]|jgi:glycine amidinotransferase|nr:amidinotransferase [Thermoanaerobaculia bacterium]